MVNKTRSHLKKRILLLLVALLVIFLVFCGFFAYRFYDIYFKSSTEFREATRLLYIPRNSSFENVADLMEKEGVIVDGIALRTYAKLKGYDTKSYSGCYTIERGMSMRSIMLMLVSRRQTPIKLVVPSVRTTGELAIRLAKQLDLTTEELLQHLTQVSVAQKFGFTLEQFPAMFIPNTYEVYWDTSPEKLLLRLHKEYNAFWNGLRKEQANQIGLSPIEVATLASIIQEEVMHEEELPKIARVYLNRLKINMLLQACPTAKFAAGNMSISRVLNVHLQIDSPYNTYKYHGLPPGPIRYPSLAALLAVLHPDENDYLFFCARADFSGYHHFSHTGAQHAAYAKAYQRELNRRGIRS